MDLKTAYLAIADRAVTAAEFSLTGAVQEAAAFHSYHAFESLGGAFAATAGVTYPRSHTRKVNAFVRICSGPAYRGTIGRQVATLAIEVSGVRNKSLYPHRLANGDHSVPADQLTEAEAETLVRRVKGITSRCRREL